MISEIKINNSYELDVDCFRFEKANINAMVNGYKKANNHVYQFIYAITNDKLHYFENKARKLVISTNNGRFIPKVDVVKENPELSLDITKKYIAVCEQVYRIKNSFALWNKLCEKSDYYYIWNEEEPRRLSPIAIGLLRVYECYEPNLHILKHKSDYKYPYIHGTNRSVTIKRPIIASNIEFDLIRVEFEKSIENYLDTNYRTHPYFGMPDHLIKDDENEQLQIFVEKVLEKNRDIKENERVLRELALLKRNRTFVLELKAKYDNKCQICGLKIEIGKNIFYSEIHHIQPVGSIHNGPDIKCNMICVCPNHHVQLDYGFLNLSKELLIISEHEIDEQYIKYYNDKIKN